MIGGGERNPASVAEPLDLPVGWPPSLACTRPACAEDGDAAHESEPWSLATRERTGSRGRHPYGARTRRGTPARQWHRVGCRAGTQTSARLVVGEQRGADHLVERGADCPRDRMALASGEKGAALSSDAPRTQGLRLVALGESAGRAVACSPRPGPRDSTSSRTPGDSDGRWDGTCTAPTGLAYPMKPGDGAEAAD